MITLSKHTKNSQLNIRQYNNKKNKEENVKKGKLHEWMENEVVTVDY